MSLPVLSFQQLINSQVAAMQASAGIPLDFTVGSVLLAVVESNTGNSLWLESTATALLAVTRLTTSSGNDVDTFVEQFGLTRDPAVPASGFVTFSRFTANLQATIQVGALVSSVGNGVSYSVGIDTTNPYYNASLNAYIVPISITSTSVPVSATTAGTIGNALANQITTIQSVIINIDTVTNPSAFTTGRNAESDAALKSRFVLYLNSLSKATKQALQAAILSVQDVARYELVENYDLAGNPKLGFFYALIDDGTGNASSTLLNNVAAQLDLTRGLTIAFSDYGPTSFPMSYTAHVFTDLSMPDSDVQAAVVTALQNYNSQQGFNALFPYSEVPRIIYDTNLTLSGNAYSPIINVTNWTINTGTSDVTLIGQQIPTNGSIAVTMNA